MYLIFKLSGFTSLGWLGDRKEKELGMTLRFGAWVIVRTELQFTEGNI